MKTIFENLNRIKRHRIEYEHNFSKRHHLQIVLNNFFQTTHILGVFLQKYLFFIVWNRQYPIIFVQHYTNSEPDSVFRSGVKGYMVSANGHKELNGRLMPIRNWAALGLTNWQIAHLTIGQRQLTNRRDLRLTAISMFVWHWSFKNYCQVFNQSLCDLHEVDFKVFKDFLFLRFSRFFSKFHRRF